MRALVNNELKHNSLSPIVCPVNTGNLWELALCKLLMLKGVIYSSVAYGSKVLNSWVANSTLRGFFVFPLPEKNSCSGIPGTWALRLHLLKQKKVVVPFCCSIWHQPRVEMSACCVIPVGSTAGLRTAPCCTASLRLASSTQKILKKRVQNSVQLSSSNAPCMFRKDYYGPVDERRSSPSNFNIWPVASIWVRTDGKGKRKYKWRRWD